MSLRCGLRLGLGLVLRLGQRVSECPVLIVATMVLWLGTRARD